MHYDERVIHPNEVLLFGRRLPLAQGTVRRRSVTPFPPKTTIGDYQREDRIVESEWVLSDFSGGLGIREYRPNRDDDRYEIGTLEARYRDLTLPALATQAGTLAGPVDRFVVYSERLYACKGTAVYWWDKTATTWQTLTAGSPAVAVALDASARDAAVYDGSLFILTATSLYKYNGPANTWDQYSGYGGWAMHEHDDVLYRLAADNQIFYSLAPAGAGSWDQDQAGAKLRLPTGYCQQLLVYWDATGEPALHAITKVGVFGYERPSAKFYPTPLTHPPMTSAGKGAAVWQGQLFVPVGSSLYKYTGNLVQVVGPDKDDGLPAHLQGDLRGVVAGHGHYYAVLNATPDAAAGDTEPLEASFIDPQGFFAKVATNGALLTSPGQAWHMLYQHLAIDSMGDAIVAGVDDTFRLWYSTSAAIYYVDLPTGLHNPLANPITRYAAEGVLDTAWSDMRWAELDKVALSLDVETEGCSATETVTIYLGFDHDPAWTQAVTVTANGQTRVAIGGVAGRKFRTARVRIAMARGSDTTKTPVLKSLALGYLRAPRQLDGWEIELDLTEPRCTDKYAASAVELVEWLYQLKRDKRAGHFTYRDSGVEPRTRHVWLHAVIGAEQTGETVGGRYNVTLLELDT